MSTTLRSIDRQLARVTGAMHFSPPVAYVYNPLIYARRAHEQYLDRYGRGPKEVLLLGMNPGPWGMAQTGVPFGEVSLVRDWLGIDTPVDRPPVEHPKRPVEGFACQRSEVSGRRLWSWVKERFGTPDAFFERFFVVNHCPLYFIEEGGRNRTPDKVQKAEREPLLQVCDEALAKTVALLKPRHVVGVGAYGRDRARKALQGMDVAIGAILHPSPASPKANRGWAQQAEQQFAELGIALP